ncbi:MAG: glycosyltransferase [Gaiellaceae bacterium]
MRVLHLPINVASHMSATVRGLRDNGVDARGIVTVGSAAVQAHDGIEVLTSHPSRRSPSWWLDMTCRSPHLAREIARADVLHWYMTPTFPAAVDLRFARMLRKPGVAEFAGGDVRVPEIEAADNPYYAAAFPSYEWRSHESAESSARTQRRFRGAGCVALVSCWSLLPYLDRELFPDVPVVRQRVYMRDLEPRYPDPAQRRPLVVHASTAPVAKATAAVLAAVDALRGEVDFEFVLLERAPREEALELMRRADVYLDQFMLGSHGSAAVEAMALGTPVVGYVKPSMHGLYPDDLPLVPSTQEELPEVLRALLTDGDLRQELGRRSRAYAEREHDATRLAPQLVEVYERAIASRA